MKKRILALMLAAVTAMSLAGCGAEEKKPQMKTQEVIVYYTKDGVYNDNKSGDVANKTLYKFDKDGNIIYSEFTNQEGVVDSSEMVWEKKDGILKGISTDGSWTEIEFDKDGNPISTKAYSAENELMQMVESEYKNGILCSRKVTNTMSDSVQKMEYDEMGQVTYSMMEIDKQKQSELKYDNVYDENGNLTSVFVIDVLDQIDYVDTYEYNADGHLKRVSQGRNGYTNDIECDEDGNILETRTYDSNGKLVMQQINTWYED